MKKIVSIFFCLSLLLCTACSEDGQTESAGAKSSNTSNTSSDSSEETAYIPGNPSTAPLFLTEVPENWEVEEIYCGRLGETCVDYIEKFGSGDDESEITYAYGQNSGRLYRIHVSSLPASKKTGSVLSKEEMQDFADDFLSDKVPLELFVERHYEFHHSNDGSLTFEYSISREFGEWLYNGSDPALTTVTVDPYGNLLNYYLGYLSWMNNISIPDVTVDEIKAKAMETPEYAEFLTYKNAGYECCRLESGSFEIYEIDEENSTVSFAFVASLSVYGPSDPDDPTALQPVLFYEKLYFPFSDFA